MSEQQSYILKTEPANASFKINYLKELNEEQGRVVCDGEGPCLVLAGAGSGKTRTLVYRVAYLLERGVAPEQILLVTFTNKAAKEMLERVRHLLGDDVRGLWGGTFHSIANRILRMYGNHLGYDQNFTIIDSDDSRSLITQIYKELNIPKNSFIPKAKVIQSLISFAQNSQLSPEQILNDRYSYLQPESVPVIARIAQEYQDKKRQNNTMDFDDLLVNWLRLLQSQPEVAAHLTSRFRYVLVDEFQDTNKVQAAIVTAMAQPHNNLLVVGDDAQSIYSFRAATVENILSFQQVYANARIFKLETNYRSTPEILQLANQSIRNNEYQYAKQLTTPNASSQKPIMVPCRDQKQQAQVIAQRVLELRDEGLMLNEIAVLFRSSFQIIELELELNRRGIPYIVRGGLRFFEQAHIKDALAFVKLLSNPKDEVSWRRILGLYEGIGPATMTKIWKRLNQEATLSQMLSVLGQIPGKGKVAASLARLQRLLLALMGVKEAVVANSIQLVLEHGYKSFIEKNFDDPNDRLEDLYQLSIFAQNYPTLEDFLSEAALSEGFKAGQAKNEGGQGEEVLVLSTIHQAKGLEWDAVFGLSLAEGQFPHYKVMDMPKEIEEERRLFYVLVTRARKQLYLTYPIMSRSMSSGDVINRPSQFLREVDQDLFDIWQVTEMAGTYQRATMRKSKVNDRDNLVYVGDDDQQDTSGESGTSILDMIRNI